MKISSAWAIAIALASTTPMHAMAANGAPEPGSEQRKALLERAAAIGPQQQRLAALAGDWAVVVSLLMDPAHPAVEQGMATLSTVLGGRHLHQDLRFTSMGKPFEGIGYIGYDNVTGKYFSSWMDTSFTGAMLAHGGYDAATNSYTFFGGQPDPTRTVAVIPVREVLHVVDDNHFSYEYHEVHGGKEAIAVRLEYSRR